MFSDADLPEPLIIQDIENPAILTEINKSDGIFFNSRYTSVRIIRKYVYNLLLEARKSLPKGYNFIIYEAYRPMDAQIKLWDSVVLQKQKEFPEMDITSEEFISICNIYAANPYRQGSGHQSGASIDISLVDDNGTEYDMGGEVRGFNSTAEFDCPCISEQARQNRTILKSTLTKVGFINYPAEWWHYSFGDRLWAKLTGSKLAIFSKLDI